MRLRNPAYNTVSRNPRFPQSWVHALKHSVDASEREHHRAPISRNLSLCPRPPNLDCERACMQVQCSPHPLSIGTELVVEGSLRFSRNPSSCVVVNHFCEATFSSGPLDRSPDFSQRRMDEERFAELSEARHIACRSEAEQYYADSRCHYAWPIAFAVHYRSTGWKNCCEPQRQRQTFYTKLLPISAAARSSRSRSTLRAHVRRRFSTSPRERYESTAATTSANARRPRC